MYEQLKDFSKAQIVFAGELRVIGGQVVSLIDQASTFYETVEAYKAFGKKAKEQLILENQLRLDEAVKILRPLGLFPAGAKLNNFQKQFRHSPEKNPYDGHIRAQTVADFERKCRSSVVCWNQFKKVDPYLRRIVKKGGSQFILEHLNSFLKIDLQRGSDFILIWTMILGDGLIDFMAMTDVLSKSNENSFKFNQFIQDLPLFLGEDFLSEL